MKIVDFEYQNAEITIVDENGKVRNEIHQVLEKSKVESLIFGILSEITNMDVKTLSSVQKILIINKINKYIE